MITKLSKSNKKGISPIIAAVMLMALVVSIGAVLMAWTKEYVSTELSDSQSKIDGQAVCGSDVSIQLVEISGVKQICYIEDPSKYVVRFTFTNGPSHKLVGMYGQALGNGVIQTFQRNRTIDVGETVIMNVTFWGASITSSNIRKLEIRPIVQYEDRHGLRQIVCKDHAFERTLINQCT